MELERSNTTDFNITPQRPLSEIREWVGTNGFFGLSPEEVSALEEAGDIPKSSLQDITGEHEIVGETDA